MATPKEKRPRLYCQHCQQTVSNSTFYRHRVTFFNTEENANDSNSDHDSSIEAEEQRQEHQEDEISKYKFTPCIL